MSARDEAPNVTELTQRLIVVVDNEAAGRVNCAAVLREAGFQVIEAKDGQEGIALALSENPDFVVYVLPSGGGRAKTKLVALEAPVD